MSAQGHYVFDAINFEPIGLAEVGLLDENDKSINPSDPGQEPKFTFTVFGRTDTRIFGVPAGHQIDTSDNYTD